MLQFFQQHIAIGGKHQLVLNADHVNGPDAVLLIEGADGAVILAGHDLQLILAAMLGIVLQRHGRLDFSLARGAEIPVQQPLQPVPDAGLNKGFQPVSGLHHVGVRIVDDTTFNIGHCDLPWVAGLTVLVLQP